MDSNHRAIVFNTPQSVLCCYVAMVDYYSPNMGLAEHFYFTLYHGENLDNQLLEIPHGIVWICDL